MLILADVGNVAEARDQLTRWIDDGGVLVRFAGPRLAAADDDLVPVKLRRGGRILGGSLSWEQPQQLAAFPRESPFFGMAVPTDVTVSRQVLAEPDATLNERTWATLADGTPLVTAQRRGKGLVVLFHVTADTRWSDLPLSGTFVDMLKRIVALAGSIATPEGNAANARGAAREVLPPTRVLDGFGLFGPPPPTAPSNLAATQSGGGNGQKIALTWKNNATNATGNAVDRSTDQSTWTRLTSSLGPAVTSYTDTKVQRSTTYYYRVGAVNASGTSFSNIASATTK